MKKFKIVFDWIIKEVVTIEAKDKDKAKEKFYSGQHDHKPQIVKSSPQSIIEIKEVN